LKEAHRKAGGFPQCAAAEPRSQYHLREQVGSDLKKMNEVAAGKPEAFRNVLRQSRHHVLKIRTAVKANSRRFDCRSFLLSELTAA
jgi:hypothetical protein